MNIVIVLLIVAAALVVAALAGIVWFAYPRGGLRFSKPFNRTIGRSEW
jgi:hypothetical protein